MGIPPPTLASNSRLTPFCLARDINSGPDLANTSLLAVTTCLPAARASFRKRVAGSVPPITSAKIRIPGSARISSGLVVIRLAEMPGSLGLAASRTRIFLRLTRRPTFLEISSDCSNRAVATPPPTTPRPNNPTLISSDSSTTRLPLPPGKPLTSGRPLTPWWSLAGGSLLSGSYPGGAQSNLIRDPCVPFAVKIHSEPTFIGSP